MPRLRFFHTIFAHKTKARQRLSVYMAVSDGAFPPVDRAEEYIESVGYSLPEWVVLYVKECDELPDCALPVAIPFERLEV